MTRRIGVTLGEPLGIGPQIVARSLAKIDARDHRFFVYGNPDLFDRTLRALSLPLSFEVAPAAEGAKAAFVCVPRGPAPRQGRFDPDDLGERARSALGALEGAAEDLRAGFLDALVTAPVDKAVIRTVLPGFLGHTEHLGALEGCRPVMMLENGEIRVVLMTTHIALREVPGAVSGRLLTQTVEIASDSFRERFGVLRPRIALAGLNPHAGETVEGSEEAEVFAPALEDLRTRGVDIEGPFAADTLFSKARSGRWDFLVSPYHDQGLVAVKYPGLHRVSNITLGLPYLRTSPGHGVAYDLVGSDRIDIRSFERALDVARNGRLEPWR